MKNRRSISTLLVPIPISLHERMVILLKPNSFICPIYFYYLVHFPAAPKPISLIRKRGLLCKTGGPFLHYGLTNRYLFIKEWFNLLQPKKLILHPYFYYPIHFHVSKPISHIRKRGLLGKTGGKL